MRAFRFHEGDRVGATHLAMALNVGEGEFPARCCKDWPLGIVGIAKLLRSSVQASDFVLLAKTCNSLSHFERSEKSLNRLPFWIQQGFSQPLLHGSVEAI
jgi:hypothetical protein